MDEQGGCFRHKKMNFSMVSNAILEDETISLKAKGLYALIQSYITIEGFTLYKGLLKKKCTDGKASFETAWNELKDHGYLVQHCKRNKKNQFAYEYELLDSPVQVQVEVEVELDDTHFSGCGSSGCEKTGCKLSVCEKGGSYNNTVIGTLSIKSYEEIVFLNYESKAEHESTYSVNFIRKIYPFSRKQSDVFGQYPDDTVTFNARLALKLRLKGFPVLEWGCLYRGKDAFVFKKTRAINLPF